MAKGKGRGKGRGRPKQSENRQPGLQRTEKIEPGGVQNTLSLGVNESCRPGDAISDRQPGLQSTEKIEPGSVQNTPYLCVNQPCRPDDAISDRQPGLQSCERIEPASVQNTPYLCVNEPCRPDDAIPEPAQRADSEYLLSMKRSSPQKLSVSSRQAGPKTSSSNDHKLCENGAAELKTESPSHNRSTLCADVPPKETNVQGIVSSQGSSGLSQTTSDVNTLAKVTYVVNVPPRSKKIDIITRPNYGTQGKRIEVVANYFLLKGKGNDVYHYDVEIIDVGKKAAKERTIKEAKASGATELEIQQKRSMGKQRCREVINQLINEKNLQQYYPFYDGLKNLYTCKPLPITGKATARISLIDTECTKNYLVSVQIANKNGPGNVIELDSLNAVCTGDCREIPHEAVTAFDLILFHRDPPFHEVNVGRSFFSFTEMRKSPLDGQVEIWKGFNQSVHLTQRGPAVVINVSNKAFHSSGFVIEHACDVLGFDITRRKLNYEDIQKLSKSLSGVKVEVTHLPYPRKYTVLSVSKLCAKELTVDIGGKDMSVAQFFKQKYRALKFPDLPCLAMRSTGKPTYTPMEFCVIVPGQPKLGKLDKRQISEMINKTAIPPVDRFESIQNFAETVRRKSGPYMKQYGLEMELAPLTLIARVISPPALAYKNVPSVKPDTRGVWRIDGKNFCKASNRVEWILISFANPASCTNDMLQQLSENLVRASRNVGLNLNRPVAIKSFDGRTTTHDALCYVMGYKVDFAFAVLSRTDKHHSYEELKFIADVKLGLITQCMEDVVAAKCCIGNGNSQIMNNIFSKLNIKLGGINHTFSQQPSVSMKRTIVMGADAAHSPRGSKCPSIAAVVGSVDEVPFQYAVTCKVQENPDQSKISQEIILDMKKMTKHILSSYRDRNNAAPERIVFFRDGVSQGQFETVLQTELSLIQKACVELFKKVLPITFIVVQKRHQTRFMPRNSTDGVGRGGNVPPGMTVDTDVVHPVYFDFFICSHEGIKGTSKPAHYVVLHDDNRFKADDLQKFCYELCHVYARCNRSISIPAPAMNAHLAAARAKKYIDWHILNDTGSSSGYSSDDSYSLPQEVKDFVNNISTIKTPMFFV